MSLIESAPPTSASPAPARDDVQPCHNETLDRFLTGLVTGIPILALGIVGWQLWNSLLHVSDLIVLAIMYVITCLGITVGFHRLFTHRSFKTGPRTRGVLAVMGMMAIEGPVISWVADHRKHHAFSDHEGDPHSPHLHGHGLKGALHGLFHAHVGWIFMHDQRGSHDRYAPDLQDDPVVSWANGKFFYWVLLGLALPFGLGWLIGGSLATALTGLLWGGAVRMLLLHHVTYSINSICHVFGRKAYESDDESRNVGWLALFSMGESWHNNHHAFPTSAHHGLRWYQVDLSALVIRGMERVGLAWDVVRPSAERMAAKQR
ncbi:MULTISPECIES: acyl-CoA desaturase [Solirubrobacterales]|uniref:acyl-CoA desaturase n=1 Tax=Solirubrobacterales TaxID=588673 RepID=UPI001E64A742|nr:MULTISPECIES: acyl-CoA desaturase [Solirubrobacterales]